MSEPENEQSDAVESVVTGSRFGKLRLSALGTSNGRGFDILYDFGKSLNFAEFTSKPEFLFIQPWMQFPSEEYTETCKLVSLELVERFNSYEPLKEENKRLRAEVQRLREEAE